MPRLAMMSTLGLLAFLCLATPAYTQDALKENSVTVSGTSTVRDWMCSGTASTKTILGESTEKIPGLSSGVLNAEITIAVSSLDCDNKKMEEHLQKALKMRDHPNIQYVLREYTLNGDNTSQITGDITIAGHKEQRTIAVTIKPLPDNAVLVTGVMDINMIDFNVEPPKLMLGTLRVGKDVKINFSVKVQHTEGEGR